MRIDRTRNAARNIFSGVILKAYQLFAPFCIRTLLIYSLGMEYAGLNALFTSILQVLNLAELGVGSAMVYSMYKPIVQDDIAGICAFMRQYRRYYRLIGLVIMVAGVALIPFLPKLISGTVPTDINLYLLYLMNLAATVASYWLFAWQSSLLTAYQRVDVINRVTLAVLTAQYILQAVALVLFHSYYVFLAVMLVSQLVTNLITAVVSKKMYPQYRPTGVLQKAQKDKLTHRIADLFTSKIGEVIVVSADTIVISAFLGLTVLSRYNNYFYILTAVLGLATVIFSSTLAGIGNSLMVESAEKNFQDFQVITLLTCFVGCIGSTCMINLYQPFIRLWVGENNLLSYGCVICFAGYFFIRLLNQCFIVYKDAAGMWRRDRFRPLVTALVNLALNLSFVRSAGLYGVLLSTIVSTLFVGMPWLIRNLFSDVFHAGLGDFVRSLLAYMALSLSVCAANGLLFRLFADAGVLCQLLVGLLMGVFLPVTVFVLVFRRTQSFQKAVLLTKRMLLSFRR